MDRNMQERTKHLFMLAVAGLLVGILSGCQSINPTPISDEDATPPTVMRLLPGDEIEISFFGAPDLSLDQRIRRDGRIGMRLIGDIVAAGKTVQELENELTARYKEQIQIQSISVVVKVGPTVIVNGAVMVPGRVEITRPMTALDAVMAVGGFDIEKAQVGNVVVIRHEGQQYKGYRLDLEPALAGGQGRAFYLQPNDIVYVPRTMWR